MKTYTSKNEIYQDYPIALKFNLHIPEGSYMRIMDYEGILSALSDDTSSKIAEFSRSVKNFVRESPLSIGLFVEFPEKGDAGQDFGLRFIMLEHETGPEWFIPLSQASAIAAGAWVGAKVAEKVFGKVLDSTLDKIHKFLSQKWSKLHPEKFEIDHVEIRTAEKGVMRIRFSDFHIYQIRCLIERFDKIKHISDVNDHCFGGALVSPPGRSIDWDTASRLEGAPPPLQACD